MCNLNSKILILMKNTRILRSDTKEILFQEIRGKFLFFLPPLETFLHLKVTKIHLWKCIWDNRRIVHFPRRFKRAKFLNDWNTRTHRTTSFDCHLKGCYMWKLGNFHCKWISTNRVAGANLQPVKGGIRAKHEKTVEKCKSNPEGMVSRTRFSSCYFFD